MCYVTRDVCDMEEHVSRGRTVGEQKQKKKKFNRAHFVPFTLSSLTDSRELKLNEKLLSLRRRAHTVELDSLVACHPEMKTKKKREI